MRLCYVANPGWPHVQKWATWFASRPGCEVHFVSEQEPGYDGVHWQPFRLGGGGLPLPWTLRAYLGFRAAFRRIRPDLVHLHNLEYLMFPAALAWRGPLVLTTYGLDITRFAEHSAGARTRAAKRYVLRRADALTAASEFLAAETARCGGLPGGRVRVTPFGVDTQWLRRGSVRSGNGPVTICMPKDLKPEYGPLEFIRAVGLLRSRGKAVRGVLVGEGPLRAEAEALVRALGLEGVVEVRRRVPLEEVRAVYERADICAMPSHRESFGVVALEAQSMELPVVAGAVEGLKEVLLDGITGFLVPPGDPEALAGRLELLVDRADLRREMGRAGRAFVEERFDWRRSAAIMERIYTRQVGHECAQ